MRFACQSCGKAYNLPEERIADKSNVKLKCRVCGAIVEVKRQGEFVAQVLDEVDGRRVTRVSEAPAPLNSLTPEDDEADGATVSISEGSIHEGGPLHFELPSVPLASPTGFSGAPVVGMSPPALNTSGAAALPPPLLQRELQQEPQGEQGAGFLDAPQGALPMGPPPLSPSSLPPPPLRADAPAQARSNGAGNGRGEYFGEDVHPAPERKGPELLAPVASSLSPGPSFGTGAVMSAGPTGMVAGPAATVNGPAAMAGASSSHVPELTEPGAPEVNDPLLFKLKMAAAFATGVMVDRIILGMFQ